MSNAKRNQKKPSKYGKHGKASVEATLVRSFILGYEISIKCFFCLSYFGLFCRIRSYMGVVCRKKKTRSPLVTKLTTIGME